MIVAYLKEKTQKIHKEVEQTSMAMYAMNGSMTLEQYGLFLVQNYKAYLTIERVLLKSSDKIKKILGPFIGTTKSTALQKDLQALGYKEEMLANIPSPYQIQNLAQAVGALYVIEGSMLGGLLIQKKLKNCAELKEIHNFHFFGSNPQESLVRWQTFCAMITKQPFNEEEANQALDVAKKTFDVFALYQKTNPKTRSIPL